ncbi:hypothetical protein BMS3Abin07_00119 [bacterium BMS3Abin07]|nr:hypothetical protein BMS3Abin07_00119 [bacterium BMS3Abin07]GBE32317.1 hypothetical protein BMS3Bbin05_01228 [bacterium BMS3Bbin05]
MKIVKSIKSFLEEISGRYSDKTVQKYDTVLDLFSDYLLSYGEISYKEDKGGEFILTADTKELEFGHAGSFLDWFLIRKVMGPPWVLKAAPDIIKKYFEWLDHKELLAEGVMKEVAEITRQTAKDLPRVEKASGLFYKLCRSNSLKFMQVEFDDDNYMEGYGEVTGIIEDKLYLDYEGEKIGPIRITKEIAKYLGKGDTVNLVVGRKGKRWFPLEVGNVYPG